MEQQSAPQDLVRGACGDGKDSKGTAGSALRRPTPARKSFGRTSGGGRLARLHRRGKRPLAKNPCLTAYFRTGGPDALASLGVTANDSARRAGGRGAQDHRCVNGGVV